MDRSEFANRETINFNDSRASSQYEVQPQVRQALRLRHFESGRSMSDIVIEALTARRTIASAWESFRKIA